MPAKPAILLICSMLLAACGTPPSPLVAAPAVPPTTSVEQADRKLAHSAAERSAIEAGYLRAEQLCYAKFFVNTCLDAAKEKRRSGLAGLRAIEVEAERYKRQAVVEQRDRELAQAEKEFQEQQARAAAEPPKPPREAGEPPPPRAPVAAGKAAANAAKLKQLDAQEQAGAAKRAAHVAAYEKKRRQSEERKREVEAKKAEKAARDAAAK